MHTDTTDTLRSNVLMRLFQVLRRAMNNALACQDNKEDPQTFGCKVV